MYRILTEDKNRESIFRILDAAVEGYTVTPAIGSWKGQRENSLAIDFIDTPEFTVVSIAEAIRKANGQESVLVILFQSHAVFINGDGERITNVYSRHEHRSA
jgi:hypothetical protein